MTVLSDGWKVELGIGDPAAIADVGLYDTATYADVQLFGDWVRGGAGTSGQWNPTSTGVSFSVNDLDDAGGDRSAAILAATYPCLVRFISSTATVEVEVSVVVDQGDQIRLFLDPNSTALDVFPIGGLVQITWFDPGFSRYGSDEPFGYLLDVTQFARSINTRRGRDRFTSRFRTGVASVVLDDNEGFFTPPAGIQPPIGVLPLRPGRELRVSYKEAVVFSGFIDSFDSRSAVSGDITTVVKGSDRFAAFNRNDLLAVTGEGAGDTTTERMQRLLDHFLSDGTLVQMFGEPFATMQATTMGQSLLTEIQLAADSEGGGCWIDVHGDVVASAFTYFQDLIDEGPKWVVGGTSPIPISNSDSAWEAIRILNEAHYSRAGGTEQVKVNSDSQNIYGRRTQTRLDLTNDSDPQVAVIAQRLVDFAGVDRQRLTEIVFIPEPDSPTALMATVADFGDVFQVTINTLWGWSYTVLTQLFQIEHTVTDELWLCTLRTDDTLFDVVPAAFERASFNNDAFS